MKLEKAIEFNTKLVRELDIPQRAKEKEAVKLGIEALKFRLQLEQEDPDITLEPLPGETEE